MYSTVVDTHARKFHFVLLEEHGVIARKNYNNYHVPKLYLFLTYFHNYKHDLYSMLKPLSEHIRCNHPGTDSDHTDCLPMDRPNLQHVSIPCHIHLSNISSGPHSPHRPDTIFRMRLLQLLLQADTGLVLLMDGLC